MVIIGKVEHVSISEWTGAPDVIVESGETSLLKELERLAGRRVIVSIREIVEMG